MSHEIAFCLPCVFFSFFLLVLTSSCSLHTSMDGVFWLFSSFFSPVPAICHLTSLPFGLAALSMCLFRCIHSRWLFSNSLYIVAWDGVHGLVFC